MSRRGTCRQFASSGSCTYGSRCKFTHEHLSHISDSISETSTSPLDNFFGEYSSSGFSYDQTHPAWDEFNRLSSFLRWGKERKMQERQRFRDAIVLAFNAIYGTDEDDIESWHTLCRVLSIFPLPEGLEASRQAVKKIYVNLVDLVDLPNSENELVLFDSELELSVYTRENHKIFPQDNAYAGGLLKHLLRHIFSPRTGRRYNAEPSRRRRK